MRSPVKGHISARVAKVQPPLRYGTEHIGGVPLNREERRAWRKLMAKQATAERLKPTRSDT